MFKKKDEIKHIVNYTILNGKLLAIRSDGESLLFEYDLEKSIISESLLNEQAINRFINCGDKILGIRIDGSCVLYDKKLSKSSVWIDKSIRIGLDDNCGDSTIAYRGKIREIEFGLFSILENRFKWSRNDVKALQRIDNDIFSQDKFILFKHDPLTGKEIWQRDFKAMFPSLHDENGRILIFGTYEEKIYLGINNIDKLICLDSQNGEIKWSNSSIISGKKIDKVRGVMHSFLNNYTQLSLDTGEEIKSFVDREYFNSIGIETQRSNYILLGDHIITTDWKYGKIGSFNIETLEFDWIYNDSNISFPAGRNMKYFNPYLIVFDSKESIHVFEKSKIIEQRYS